MTQIWNEKGKVVPVTILEAGPCTVVRIKSNERDGYSALQIGLPRRRRQVLREIRLEGTPEFKDGDVLDVGIFAPGDKVKVTGVSKGKGFQGVVKRHHFHGHPPTHGHKDQERMPGAIGAGGVQHVFKGTRMAGRMGGARVTVRGLAVVEVDKEKNRLMVKGAVPGARNSLLMIQSI